LLALPAPPARRALLQPTRRALLLRASRPTAACTSRPTALRVAPCCSQRVAPYCSQRVGLCCPARRALLLCASRPAVASASRPIAASASRSAAPRIASCRSQRVTPYCSQRIALCCPTHRALLPCTARALLPSPPSRPAATTAAAAAAAAARASAAAGGGAVGSGAGAGGAGGAGDATRSAGGAAGAGRATGSAGGAAGAGAARGGQRRSLPLQNDPTPQQLGEWQSQQETFFPQVLSELFPKRCVTGSVEAAALGASESAAALGARASLAIGPSSAEALHTFTRYSVVARASTVLPCPAVPSGSLSCLHLPTFSTNLVSNAAIQNVWVDTFIPGQRVAICTCLRLVSLQCLARVGYSPSSTTASVTPPYRISAVCTPVSLSLAFPGPCPPSCARLPRHAFTLPASPQQNGIAERRISLIMEVSRTSMIHAGAPHFLWPFAVQYAAHQLNLWPHVSEPETLPTLRWTEKVGDASVFRVWGTLSLVRDAKASKLSSCTLRCIFLGFPTDAPPWKFYHPCSRLVFSSQDVTFDESVCYYRLHPHASHPVPLAPLFLVPILPPSVDPLPPQGPASSGVSQVDPPPLVEPSEVSSDSSGPAEGGDPAVDDAAATRRSPRLETPPGFPPRPSSPPPQPAAVDSGAETAGAEPGGAETEGEGSGGAFLGCCDWGC
ncbi:unnamed protein product, partial [Closterium sp. NIES-54]